MNRYVSLALPLALAAVPMLAFGSPPPWAPASSTARRQAQSHQSVSSTPAASQKSQSTTPPTEPPSTQPPEVSDATLIKFVKATDALKIVRKSYAPKVKAASTVTAKKAIKQQERQKMRNEVAQYMPVSDYLQLEKQIRNDPQLQARTKKLMRERAASKGAGSTPPSTDAKIDDATLQKFLKAAAAARNVRAEYKPKIKAASDATARNRLQMEQRKAAGNAIEQYMPVPQFMQIEKQMHTDPNLRARAKAMVDKARTKSPSAASSG